MRINFTPYKLAFTSNHTPKLPKDGVVLGYDDSISSSEREYIREHLMDNAMLKYSELYGGRKTDSEMNSMLEGWGLKVNKFTGEINIPPYLNFIALDNNNFRGALSDKIWNFKDLKASGITTVIAATPHQCIKNVVEKTGMEFIELIVKNPFIKFVGRDYIFNDFAFLEEEDYIRRRTSDYKEYSKYDKEYYSEEAIERMLKEDRNDFQTKSREFIDELIKTVRAWQHGCCFIGCELGTGMTNKAISLIDAFNPMGSGRDSRYLSFCERDSLKILYEKLTPKDKALLGWTKNFENTFLKLCRG